MVSQLGNLLLLGTTPDIGFICFSIYSTAMVNCSCHCYHSKLNLCNTKVESMYTGILVWLLLNGSASGQSCLSWGQAFTAAVWDGRGWVEQTADWSNVADRCRDNLKTIVFLTETNQTCPSASAIKVSDMFSGEGAPARAHDAGRFNRNAPNWSSSWAASCSLSLFIRNHAQPRCMATFEQTGVVGAKPDTGRNDPHFSIAPALRNSISLLHWFLSQKYNKNNKLTHHLIYCVWRKIVCLKKKKILQFPISK